MQAVRMHVDANNMSIWISHLGLMLNFFYVVETVIWTPQESEKNQIIGKYFV